MSVLKGRQFFAWEVAPLLSLAYSTASEGYFSKLDSIEANNVWRKAFGEVAAVRVAVNSADQRDQLAPSAPSYRQGSDLWNKVDDVLSKYFASDWRIAAEVKKLPIDSNPPSRISPYLAFGLAIAVVAVGFQWVKR